PKITIQNTGSTTLTSLQIEYWVNGATSHEIYQWSGNLNFLEKENIELPDPPSLWDNIAVNNNVFHVAISLPNNAADQYYFNNIISSTFESAPTYPNTFVLWFQTNNGIVSGISESSWEFFDNNENLIYASGNLIPNTQFRDTLTFDDGCYIFKVTDTDDDGLDFWANNDGGGMVRFREIGASWLKSFDGDFGRFIHHEFMVENILSNSEINDVNITIFPNPATNEIVVIGNLVNSSKLILTDNIGRIVSVTNIDKNNNTHKINVKNLSQGIYFISIDNNTIKKVVKQ
ncbi:MAG: T9SS type A sorting domain-containing protein, partial [Bacteroidota bacterium]|nr:T9SS type A sorting domain-containing protein [Bacteroidota bacterium]